MGTGSYGKKHGARSKKKGFKRSRATKVRKKDVDQIQEELKRREKGNTKGMVKGSTRTFDETLPGFGQHYCESCDRHFIDAGNLSRHVKTKAHKKRLKILKEEQYTEKEAYAAGQ